jgi:hypothetical protein
LSDEILPIGIRLVGGARICLQLSDETGKTQVLVAYNVRRRSDTFIEADKHRLLA